MAAGYAWGTLARTPAGRGLEVWRGQIFLALGTGEQRVGHQRDEGAEDDDADADPDPRDQRIEEDLDDGAAGVGVLALEDDVEVGLGVEWIATTVEDCAWSVPAK